jgi:small subunit ribosomal protein S17
MAMAGQQSKKKTKNIVGKVLSHKTDKTAMITVEQVSHHPLYHKTVRRLLKFQAHDEKNEAKPGDTVRVLAVRPLSRQKRWKIVAIITRGEVPEVKPQEIT